MKKKLLIGIALTFIILVTGSFITLYFIGDKILDEALTDAIDENVVEDIDLDGSSETKNQPVSGEELKKLNDEIPKMEKVKIAKKVLEKLSIEEVNELKNIAQGGITYDEKDRVQEIVGDSFTAQEIEDLKDTYIKYK
ncbi:MAG: hypothetical protein ABF289_01165 [Clostridiales bacterium]